MRIRRTRKRDRSWPAVLAGGAAVYAVLAVGFHRLVEPGMLAGRTSLPTEILTAYRRSSEEPATSGYAPRGAPPISVNKKEPPSPADALAMAKADEVDFKEPSIKEPGIKEPGIRVPKKEPHRNVSGRAYDRSAGPRGASWSFSSSPASPNYR
jgi:hypothetical protein